MSNYLQVKAGKTLDLMARVTDADGEAIEVADVSEASYSIYSLDESDWSEDESVTGHVEVALTPADVVYDEYQTSTAWTEDDTGYNFRLQPDNGTNQPFPDEETTYLVQVALQHSTLGEIVLEWYVSTLRSLGGSDSLCTRRHVEDIFGADNVAKWADVFNDGDQDKIASRIDWACKLATAKVYGRLRGGPYTLPFDSPDALVVDAAARLAAVALYESRGAQDVDPETGAPQNLLTTHRRQAEVTLGKIMSGQLQLDADEESAGYPQVVSEN